MAILGEMVGFLDNQIKERIDVDKDRNIKMICYYYGFGGVALPTLDDTAQQFEGLGTRQRVQQIIDRDFRKSATPTEIPSAISFQQALHSRPHWALSELDRMVTEQGIAGGSFTLPGLLRLIRDLHLQTDYGIYTPDLQSATRVELGEDRELFLLRRHQVPLIRKVLNATKRSQGLRGIVKVDDFGDENHDFASHRDLMLHIMRHSDTVWMRAVEGELWYLFEDYENTLINHARKALTAYGECDLTKLAHSILAAMHRRHNKYDYPSVDLITDYLRSSVHFEAHGNSVSLLCDPIPLTPIEDDISRYLKEHANVHYPEARDFLTHTGNAKPNIDRILFQSALVFVDKTLGRGNYTFHPTGAPSLSKDQQATDQRYATFMQRLRDLRNTDARSEQSGRREQHILRQWLFEGKSDENCAICGKAFSTGALVAAHKKRRADCNEAERRDPYIVMPLCLFGCDYLYENRLVVVINGMVQMGSSFSGGGMEEEYAQKLIGNALHPKWMHGDLRYFQEYH